MRIDPYIRPPDPPETIGLLTADGLIVDEHGSRREPGEVLCFASFDTVRELLQAGDGEALCWNGEELRWRRDSRPGNSWDATVIRLPFPESAERTLEHLSRWRGWLASWGAGMGGGSTGACAWSLLRATLDEPLWTNVGQRPRLKQTLGGRQELGPNGQGSFTGDLVHLDLPAAYASELGGLPYGGRWIRDSGLPSWWARENRPVFVRATVRVPKDVLGPLPRRPRRPVYGLRSILLGASYPSGTRLQGVWTWQELEAARANGCRIRILDTWVHIAGGRRPFARWWEAVQDGRRMPGLAGLLAKTTGNALWGQFCMDAKQNGRRTIKRQQGSKTIVEEVPFHGGRPPDHCLAETVSGRVRARLYRAMLEAGDRLLCAHTDGLWAAETQPAEGWRVKEHASRIDLLDPQVLRYWPNPARDNAPWHVFAGMPYKQQSRAFQEQWGLAGFHDEGSS